MSEAELEAELTGCEKEVARLEAENQQLREQLTDAWNQTLLNRLVPPNLDPLMRTNAEFKTAIEQLAAMLPAMVTGLGAAAVDQTKKVEQIRRVAQQSMPPGFTYNPETGDITNREPGADLPVTTYDNKNRHPE